MTLETLSAPKDYSYRNISYDNIELERQNEKHPTVDSPNVVPVMDNTPIRWNYSRIVVSILIFLFFLVIVFVFAIMLAYLHSRSSTDTILESRFSSITSQSKPSTTSQIKSSIDTASQSKPSITSRPTLSTTSQSKPSITLQTKPSKINVIRSTTSIQNVQEVDYDRFGFMSFIASAAGGFLVMAPFLLNICCGSSFFLHIARDCFLHFQSLSLFMEINPVLRSTRLYQDWIYYFHAWNLDIFPIVYSPTESVSFWTVHSFVLIKSILLILLILAWDIFCNPFSCCFCIFCLCRRNVCRNCLDHPRYILFSFVYIFLAFPLLSSCFRAVIFPETLDSLMWNIILASVSGIAIVYTAFKLLVFWFQLYIYGARKRWRILPIDFQRKKSKKKSKQKKKSADNNQIQKNMENESPISQHSAEPSFTVPNDNQEATTITIGAGPHESQTATHENEAEGATRPAASAASSEGGNPTTVQNGVDSPVLASYVNSWMRDNENNREPEIPSKLTEYSHQDFTNQDESPLKKTEKTKPRKKKNKKKKKSKKKKHSCRKTKPSIRLFCLPCNLVIYLIRTAFIRPSILLKVFVDRFEGMNKAYLPKFPKRNLHHIYGAATRSYASGDSVLFEIDHFLIRIMLWIAVCCGLDYFKDVGSRGSEAQIIGMVAFQGLFLVYYFIHLPNKRWYQKLSTLWYNFLTLGVLGCFLYLTLNYDEGTEIVYYVIYCVHCVAILSTWIFLLLIIYNRYNRCWCKCVCCVVWCVAKVHQKVRRKSSSEEDEESLLSSENRDAGEKETEVEVFPPITHPEMENIVNSRSRSHSHMYNMARASNDTQQTPGGPGISTDQYASRPKHTFSAEYMDEYSVGTSASSEELNSLATDDQEWEAPQAVSGREDTTPHALSPSANKAE